LQKWFRFSLGFAGKMPSVGAASATEGIFWHIRRHNAMKTEKKTCTGHRGLLFVLAMLVIFAMADLNRRKEA
ncbi:MAG: hypothetical protein LUG65_03845, partial [Clostridiales bacterium]|nr:hypothetical protein [Clostridiales bacterium]